MEQQKYFVSATRNLVASVKRLDVAAKSFLVTTTKFNLLSPLLLL